MDTQEVLYHYTTGSAFRRILHNAAIEPDKTEPDNPNEIPTVTFSADPDWERTRFRVGRLPDGQLVMMNKALLKQFDGGLYRIVVPKEIAPMDWFEMKEKVGMSKEAKKGIYDFAISVGARIAHWYGTFERVPEELWLNVQKLNDDDVWVDLTDEDIPEPTPELSPIVDILPEERITVPVEDTTVALEV